MNKTKSFQLVSLIAIWKHSLLAANAIGKQNCFRMQLEQNINMISSRNYSFEFRNEFSKLGKGSLWQWCIFVSKGMLQLHQKLKPQLM